MMRPRVTEEQITGALREHKAERRLQILRASMGWPPVVGLVIKFGSGDLT